MAFLTADEKHTLALICDTLVPTLPSINGDDPRLFGCGALALNIPAHLEEAIERVSDDASRQQLKWVLNALENGLFNGLTARQWGAFSELSLEERTAVLHSWAESRLPQARKLFQSLKRLTLFLFYAVMPEDNANPTWPGLGYTHLPHRADDAPRPIKPLEISGDTTLYTDVLVIGSGAGGGVVAAELSASGQDVIVIEKGPYYAEQDFHGRELESMEKLFERHGSLTTADLSMMVLAGSALGGGTTVNWSASLRTPDYVLKEWETEYGFTGASSREFQTSLDAVLKRMNVNTDESVPNRNNAVLEKGCRALGYEVSVIPRNVKGCEECGFCNFGCSFGAKQGTLKTWLQDAYNQGTRILVGARVERVLHRRGLAYGAEVRTQAADGKFHRVTVQAKRVVVAAGSLHTPALLMRSGLTNGSIGANLHLHPVTVTYGLFDEPITPWQGPPMTRLAGQFANLDGRGYGVRLETAPVHPGIAALSMPWRSGRGHKRLMGRLNHMANIIVITRDYHSGHVTVDAHGEPVLHYNLHPYDARHLMRGTLEALRIHVAAGAAEVSSPHNDQIVYKQGENLDAFLAQVESRGFRANSFTLSSAHQMSSCRIGGDSALGAVDPSGETYEIRNLFVMDGSILPTASGVNPMVSIMATAHYLAQGLKARV
ncbi:MAG: GMC family oxidoreductase N-terminal domain-containing protein [Anaerolineae bacterium]|nr:GMC family oxidoreductase N-terminal domain-containing protein [Anaerolineae bacterium]